MALVVKVWSVASDVRVNSELFVHSEVLFLSLVTRVPTQAVTGHDRYQSRRTRTNFSTKELPLISKSSSLGI